MGQMQASLLIMALLSVYLSILVGGRPTTLPDLQPACNVDKLNEYFLEVYKLYSMQDQLKAIDCNEEFNGQPINPAFCRCDSISGKQAEPQGDPEMPTGASCAILFANIWQPRDVSTAARCYSKTLQKGITLSCKYTHTILSKILNYSAMAIAWEYTKVKLSRVLCFGVGYVWLPVFVSNTTGSGLSQDRPDNLLTSPQSCGFKIILDLTDRDNDVPIAADLAIYKLPSSYPLTRSPYYTVNLTVMENSLPIITTSKRIDKETSEGWQVFRADDLRHNLTTIPHEFYVEIEVKDGEDGQSLFCDDIQTVFVLDCATLTRPSDNIPSNNNLMPILTFFTENIVPWWMLIWGTQKRDVTDATSVQLIREHQPFIHCQKVPQIMPTQDILGANYEVISPESVDIGTCVEHSVKLGGSNIPCSPAELQSAHALARDKRTNELVQKTFPVISTCAKMTV